MNERIPPARRRRFLEPAIAITGNISHWKCSDCAWTSAHPLDATGLTIPRSTVEAFARHRCEDHRKPDGAYSQRMSA